MKIEFKNCHSAEEMINELKDIFDKIEQEYADNEEQDVKDKEGVDANVDDEQCGECDIDECYGNVVLPKKLICNLNDLAEVAITSHGEDFVKNASLFIGAFLAASSFSMDADRYAAIHNIIYDDDK